MPRPARIARPLLALATALFILTTLPTFAGDLTDPQAEVLRQATAQLRSADSNIQSAASAAGTAANPAKGSRKKLALSRLNQGIGQLDQAAALLAKLPADDTGVADAQAKHDATRQFANQTLRILDPTNAPPPPAAEGNNGQPAAPAQPPLTREQVGLKKDLAWTTRQTDYWTKQLKARLDPIEKATTPVQYPAAMAALQNLNQARAEAQKAAANIQALPADHPELTEETQAFITAAQALKAQTLRFQKVTAPLSQAGPLTKDPQLKPDTDKVANLTDRYRFFVPDASQFPAFTQTLTDDAATLAEAQRIAKKFGPLITHQFPQGVTLGRALRGFQQKRTEFLNKARAYQPQIPAAIAEDLANARKYAQQGVDKKAPGFFGPNGGVVQQLGFARDRANLFAALDPVAGKTQVDLVNQTEADIKTMAASLRDQIIQNNTLPADAFGEPDRDAVIAAATAALLEQHPGIEILAVRIPMTNWKRTTEWRLQNTTWYKYDSSRVQPQVVVKHSGTLAAIRPINVYKRHLQGDSLTASPFDNQDDEIPPARLLPLAKVK
ncbi:MAG: hypothetical protein AAF797_15535 [Planctomycetota bacterium]